MQTLKDILEILYLISGPVIAVFAFLGLRQIKEARNQVDEAKKGRILHSKREAFKIASEKCEYYMEKIIPLFDELDKNIQENKIDFFERTKVTIINNEIKTFPEFKNKEEMSKVISLKVGDILNPLESFSLFFINGVADEKIGYLTIGHTYCYSVKRYLPIILPLSSNKKYYKNIIQLFLIWYSRIEKERLENEKNKIEDELSKNQDAHINPIGTE